MPNDVQVLFHLRIVQQGTDKYQRSLLFSGVRDNLLKDWLTRSAVILTCSFLHGLSILAFFSLALAGVLSLFWRFRDLFVLPERSLDLMEPERTV